MKRIVVPFFATLLYSFAYILPGTRPSTNPFTYAVAWKQTAAEYRALFYQAYNIARLHVETAISGSLEHGKPLAVITDLDDTVFLPLEYWTQSLLLGNDFFDDKLWDIWVSSYQMDIAPGALDFFEFCKNNNVEVFYISSRNQCSDSYKHALRQLQQLNLPYADDEHLTVISEHSNKSLRQNEIARTHKVVVMLGDNLNDFSRTFYTTDSEQRQDLLEDNRDLFGMKYIVFPNPTDGHWLRPVFGQSEPEPGDGHRDSLWQAATRLRPVTAEPQPPPEG